MDKSDDSILTRDIEYNDSISALDSAPRVPLLDPYDLFESNTAEIEEIKQALPKCDDSGTQLDTTSQLVNLCNDDDDSFGNCKPKSKSVSESDKQIPAQERALFFMQKITS